MNDKVGVYQKIFYSTTKYVILKNVFLITAGILSIFIVRFLSPQEYGKWALVYQLIATVGGIINLGFLSTLAKFIPGYQNIEEKNKLFSQTFFIILFVFSIFLFFYFIGISSFPKIIPKEIKEVKYVFCVFIGSLSLINLIEGYYRGLGKFNQWTVIDGSRSVLSAGLAILSIVLISSRFEIVFYTYFFIILFYLFVLLFYLRKNINPNSNLNIEPQIIRFSLIMLAGQIILLLATTIDSVLLRVLLKDPAQVGYYNAGIRIPKMLQIMLISPLSVPFLYYFSNPKTSQDREKILKFGCRMLGIICGIISMILLSLSKEIILLLFGYEYLESVLVLRIYSLIICLIGFIILIGPYFISINKPWIMVFVSAFGFIFIFIFDLLLIPNLKSLAPAIGIVLGLIIQTLVLLYILSKHKVIIFKDFVLLFFCMIVAITFGFYLTFYSVVFVFILFVLITRLFTLNDLKIWKGIIKFK